MTPPPETRPSGRVPHEMVEIAPTHCPNGHPLTAGQVLIGWDKHPSGIGPARVWFCRTCGAETWDEPLPPLPTG